MLRVLTRLSECRMHSVVDEELAVIIGVARSYVSAYQNCMCF